MEQKIERNKNNVFEITSSTLKCIAIVSMLIDHFGVAIYMHLEGTTYEGYRILRYIGRIAFPIYCFLLVEGFFYTRDVRKYIGRCFVFALLSEIPYDLAIFGTVWDRSVQNVYFTLTMGLCVLYCLERVKGFEVKNLVLQGFVIAIGAGIAQVLDFDYHYLGILFIVMFYYGRSMEKWKRTLVGALAFSYEITAPLAFIPIYFYNGKRGWNLKYIFYWVYPVHLLLYGLIRVFIF